MVGGAGSANAVGFRIMAEAVALPREIELRKQVDDQTERLGRTTGEEARKCEMAKLADLQLRLDIEREARRRFYCG